MMARPGPSPPRRKGGIASIFSPNIANSGLFLSGCCCMAVLLVLCSTGAWTSLQSFSLRSSSRAGQPMLSRRLSFFNRWKPVRKLAVGNTFGTIFHLELSMFYKALTSEPEVDNLVKTLRTMQDTGIKTVVYSMSWQWGEPEPNKVRYSYIDMLMNAACRNTDLKVDLILDVVNPPDWLWKRHLDSKSRDADQREYNRMSWFHPQANEAARRFLMDVSGYLSRTYKGCAVAIQPVYNNEYEAKYTQEYDAYQDYSPYALAEFRNWLQAKGMSLAQFNTRWSTKFEHWSLVEPPKLHGGDYMGADFSARYWDWLKFREEYGASVYIKACASIQQGGLQCFHHFPEFFSVIDAIYGASMFKHIAASPHTDFVIMDSNFMTPYGTVMNPHKLRLYIAAAGSYGKPVYFEAAVERFKTYDLLEAGFANSLLAGAENVGITNWHTRVDMNSSLTQAMHGAPACQADELVGLFLHLDSCSAFHGLQHEWKRKDPLHDFVEDLAERLSKRCETDVAVYIELDRFLAAMPTFHRVVFVEPLLLYNSTELGYYAQVKAALLNIPHEILHLPVDTTTGPQLVVLQDLPQPQPRPTSTAAGIQTTAGLVGHKIK